MDKKKSRASQKTVPKQKETRKKTEPKQKKTKKQNATQRKVSNKQTETGGFFTTPYGVIRKDLKMIYNDGQKFLNNNPNIKKTLIDGFHQAKDDKELHRLGKEFIHHGNQYMSRHLNAPHGQAFLQQIHPGLQAIYNDPNYKQDMHKFGSIGMNIVSHLGNKYIPRQQAMGV